MFNTDTQTFDWVAVSLTNVTDFDKNHHLTLDVEHPPSLLLLRGTDTDLSPFCLHHKLALTLLLFKKLPSQW